MRLPFVSRAIYDDARNDLREQRENNRLLVQQIVELRREGFRAPPKEAKPLPPTPTNPDDVVHDRVRAEYVQRAVQGLMADGMSEREALAEAERMANVLYAEFGEEG